MSPDTIIYRPIPEQDVAIITVPLPLGEAALEALFGLGEAIDAGNLEALIAAAATLAGATDGEIHVLPPPKELA